MNKLYKVAQYYKSKLAKNKEDTILFRGDIVYYDNPKELGLVLDSNYEFTDVDFSSGFRRLPTLELTFYDTLKNVRNFEQELTEVEPFEVNKNYPPFSDDEEYFS